MIVSRCPSGISAWFRPREIPAIDQRLDAACGYRRGRHRSRCDQAIGAAGEGCARDSRGANRAGRDLNCRRLDNASRWRRTGHFPSCIRICFGNGGRRARKSFRSRRWPMRLPMPAADAVWLPGGYPELHAGALASAHRFRSRPSHIGPTLRSHPRRVWRLYGAGARARGCRRRQARNDRSARARNFFRKRKLHLGYRRARLRAACSLGAAGTEVFGHEFHYAQHGLASGDPLVDCRDASWRRSARTRRAAGFDNRHVFPCHRPGSTHDAARPIHLRGSSTRLSARLSATSCSGAATSAGFAAIPSIQVLIQSLLELASHAPSVGHCQPWRFVLVESTECREAVQVQLCPCQRQGARKLSMASSARIMRD